MAIGRDGWSWQGGAALSALCRRLPLAACQLLLAQCAWVVKSGVSSCVLISWSRKPSPLKNSLRPPRVVAAAGEYWMRHLKRAANQSPIAAPDGKQTITYITCIRTKQLPVQAPYSTHLSANTAAHGGLRGSAAAAAATQLVELGPQLCLRC